MTLLSCLITVRLTAEQEMGRYTQAHGKHTGKTGLVEFEVIISLTVKATVS